MPSQRISWNTIHANEVAILHYYIANLNIEYTFKQKMQYYAEFRNLCFVDTLDNTNALSYSGKQHDMFGMTSENTERIRRQNSKKISVFIGNPPYNSNQKNENENNKNREYPFIDKRISETFIKHSTAQKTKVYDMYSRFYRYAMDRMEKNGVIAFITNRSFIDSRTFDGFRKIIASEFNAVYIVDLGGDVRANPKLSGTKHNVFGIQTGVAIMILVRKESNFKQPKTDEEFREIKDDLNIIGDPVVLYKDIEHYSAQGCRIYYLRRPEMETAKEKLEFLRDSKLEYFYFDRITPDKNNNWINLAEDNDWESLLPLATKEVKSGHSKEAVFELFSNGVVTARDQWVYDFSNQGLKQKVHFLIDAYNANVVKHSGHIEKKNIKNVVDYGIKWTRAVKNDLSKGKQYKFDNSLIQDCSYRPFIKKKLYFSKQLNEMQYQLPKLFKGNNKIIAFRCVSAEHFVTLGTDRIFDYAYLKMGNGGTFSFPFYRFDEKNTCIDNLTDWGLHQFTNHYNDPTITKEEIFHYTYAILHNPAYRKKYEMNLKREFPRLPFYEDFRKWAAWGKALMELHINYETVEPWPLERHDFDIKAEAKRQKESFGTVEEPKEEFSRKPKIRVKLKADKTTGIIEIDELTFLSGIPAAAWEYKLGNRSAMEWALDQYKEKKPSDPTIAEKFNSYRFSDYKEQVIGLLQRVCTVSVETIKIIRKMEERESG
ncbi:MAG: Eco57I restriction-modification methylase domain-containing protein [Bacteroidetes bacterium]|nr:Eco57I restriction-modification methylase domain-containing protein [Bacteroidota bacterium]